MRRFGVTAIMLLIALLIVGCASQMSIRSLVVDEYPEADQILSVDGNATLWLVRTEEHVLLLRYARGGRINEINVIAQMSRR